jgi:Uncharacterized protein conserved in bacteria
MKRLIKLDPDMLSAMGKASTIGLHMVSGVLVGGLMGWLLDKWLGTAPWLFLVFMLLGIAAGFLNVWKDARSIIAAQERSDAHARAQRGEATERALDAIRAAKENDAASKEESGR